MIDGSIHAGPNAVLSLKREGYSGSASTLPTLWTLNYPDSGSSPRATARKAAKKLRGRL